VIPLGHVGALPLEEGALMAAPLAFMMAAIVGARLGQLAAWLRRR
jgi:hypothetical protein